MINYHVTIVKIFFLLGDQSATIFDSDFYKLNLEPDPPEPQSRQIR